MYTVVYHTISSVPIFHNIVCEINHIILYLKQALQDNLDFENRFSFAGGYFQNKWVYIES